MRNDLYNGQEYFWPRMNDHRHDDRSCLVHELVRMMSNHLAGVSEIVEIVDRFAVYKN
jgi:hypothetical protein